MIVRLNASYHRTTDVQSAKVPRAFYYLNHKKRGERGRKKKCNSKSNQSIMLSFLFRFYSHHVSFLSILFFSYLLLLLLSSLLSRCAVYSLFGDISESSSHYLYVYWARPKSRLFFFHRLRLVVLLNIGKGGARLRGDFLAKEKKRHPV